MKPAAKPPAATRCIPAVVLVHQPKGGSAAPFEEVPVSNAAIRSHLPRRDVGGLQMPKASGGSAPAFAFPMAMLSGCFAAILGSLHRSRRRQARRIAREYRYLTAAGTQSDNAHRETETMKQCR